MRFRYFNSGQTFSLFSILLLPGVLCAQLDWSHDVVVFGTDQHEWSPQVVPIGDGQFRAFCVRESNVLSMRTSQLYGEVWEAFTDRTVTPEYIKFATASDDRYAYISNFARDGSDIHYRRISHTSSNWPEPSSPLVVPENTVLKDAVLLSDFDFSNEDPFVHLFVLAASSNGMGTLGHFYAMNYGQDWFSSGWFASGLPMQDSSASIAAAVTWEGENERLWVVTAIDRPGSTGEQIALYYSDDLGSHWSTQLTPDISSYAQTRPTLISRESTIMLAYQRRNNASVAREIYATYSPDNGVSWSDPLQLTDSPFDNVNPRLMEAAGEIGICYARVQVQNQTGQLLFRRASINQPWAWELEEPVSDLNGLVVSEGFGCAADEEGFAVVWSGRLIGDDGDVFFDGSWRGTASEDQSRSPSPTLSLFPNPTTGWVTIAPLGESSQIRLYDILGREITSIGGSNMSRTWKLPDGLPSGSYWLRASDAHSSVRVTLLR